MSFMAEVRRLLEEQRVPPAGYINSYRRLLRLNGKLSWHDTAQAIRLLIDSTSPERDRLAFLRSLRPEVADGEMLAGAAGVLLTVAPRIPHREDLLFDCVGTGGDRLGLFNLSTLSSLVVASAGIPVAKHGNRAITSRCGSADLLEALGVPIELGPEEVAGSLEKNRYAFLFAPRYHSATRNVQPLRKKLSAKGVPTLFNLLGPLSNPARPTHMLVGAYHPRFALPMAQALERLGCQKAWVVSGSTGRGEWMDEVSLCGPTRVVEFDRAAGLREFELSPADFGIETVSAEALKGGDRAVNLAVAKGVLEGDDSAYAEAVRLNSAVGLHLCELVPDIPSGLKRSQELLQSGQVSQLVKRLASAHSA